MKTAFDIRAAEFHHNFDLDPAGQESQEDMLGIFQQASRSKLSHVILGESWPRGLSRLIKYTDIPELNSFIDTDAVMQRQNNFAKFAAAAKELDLTLWANSNPIAYPEGFLSVFPDARAVNPRGEDRSHSNNSCFKPKPDLCPKHPMVRKLLITQVRELLKLPGIKGLSCWLNMSDSLIFSCQCELCASSNLGEVIADFANLLYTECAVQGKRLNIRTYLGSWQCGLETQAFLEAAPLMYPEIEITYKQQQGDMYNEHPLNPLVGKLASHREIIEFDTYGEYRGQSLGITCSCRNQMQERMQFAAKAGVKGVAFRGIHHIHRFSLDADLFGALALKPDLDNDAWCKNWLKARFGGGEEKILNILDRSWEVCRRSMYIKGINWASWSVPKSLERLRFILYDRSASCVEGAFERLKVTEAMISEVADIHNDAINIAEKILEDCEKLKSEIKSEDYQCLRASMEVLYAYSRLVRPLIQMVLRAFQWERLESATMREFRRFELIDAIKKTEQEIKNTTKLFENLDKEALFLMMGPIELVALPPDKRMQLPLDNAKRICDDIRELIDVKPSSFTGIVPWPERWPEGSSIADYGDEEVLKFWN